MASRTGSPASKHVLITGASGFVGGICRQTWGSSYRLRLADVRPLSESVDEHHERVDRSALAPNESFWPLDCSDYDKVLAACQGVDVVIHLAADPSGNATFDSLLPRNIIAAYNIFNAASAAGCSRVVVASTTQVMNGYGGADSAERKERGIGPEGVPWDAPVAPTNLYGASKAWAEALARVYSSSHDLSCICVRLGGFQADGQVFDEEASRVQMHNVSPRDAAQIFRLAIEAPPSVRCAIVPGISEHAVAFQNVQHTKAVLGYVPQDGTATRTNSRL